MTFIGAFALGIGTPPSEGDEGMIEVTVTGDWSGASQAWTDIQTAIPGIAAPQGSVMLHFNLWEGDGDPDDFAQYYVAAGPSSGYEIAFSSAPSSGTVYIIGASVIAG